MTDLGSVWVTWPTARIRRELDVSRGVPIRFVYQLEYDLEATSDGRPPHDWRTVARFDHATDGHHDVREEGLHLDVYRDGEKYRTTYDFPDVRIGYAPTFCERYLLENAETLLERFEQWHGVQTR